MHIELRHLRLIQAIHETGSVAAAAEQLHVTQSALSHQIKGIEDQTGVPLFVRRSRPLRLSAAGRRMLEVAQRVLPEMQTLRAEFEGLQDGRGGRLHIATECQACHVWLLPVLAQFSRVWPEVDIDIRPNPGGEAQAVLEREEADLVIATAPDPGPLGRVLPLFDYSPLCLVPLDHPAGGRGYMEPGDFAQAALITYPHGRARLDVFAAFLTPAGVEPAALRQVELSEIMAMLVANRRGLAVLPDWAARGLAQTWGLRALPLGDGGVTRRMHAAQRAADADLPYMAHFLRLARQEAVRLQRE